MGGLVRRAQVTAGATVVLLVSAAGVANASGTVALKWSPTTSPGTYNYGTVKAGQAVSKTFTLTNSGSVATSALTVSLTGSAVFKKAGDTCTGTLLGAQKSCQIIVTYDQGTAGRSDKALLTATSAKPAATASLTLLGATAAVPHLYWTTSNSVTGSSAVNEANLDGSKPRVLTSGSGVELMAVGRSRIYWAGWGINTITEANLDGTSPQTLISAAGGPFGVAVNTSHLYWTNERAGVGTGAIWEANLDGGSPHAILTGLPAPSGIAVRGLHLYWADESAGTINQANLDGTSQQTLVKGVERNAGPVGLAVDSSHLYWADFRVGTINRANLDGTSPRAIVSGQNEPWGLAVYGSHLYWANMGSGFTASTISEANLDGSSPHPIVKGPVGPLGVAVGP